MFDKWWASGALCAAIGLTGCATGQDSLVAISPSGDVLAEASASSDPSLARAAPNLLAVSGTALLPGSRLTPSIGLLSQGGVIGPVANGGSLIPPTPNLVQSATRGLLPGAPVSLDAGSGLQASLAPSGPATILPATAALGVSPTGAQASVALATPVVGPLLSISGANSRLAAGSASIAILRPTTRSTPSVGVGALAVAPTQITVSATTALSQSTMGSGGAPMTGPRLPVTANPALLAGLTGRLPVIPGRN